MSYVRNLAINLIFFPLRFDFTYFECIFSPMVQSSNLQFTYCISSNICLLFMFKAREYLHFKLFGKQCITPVAIMTSAAKNNHEHISLLCDKLQWFGRGQSTFQLFEQVYIQVSSV